MSGVVFLDTSGWLAALNSREHSHPEASRLYQGLIGRAARLVTSNLVVAEMHILLARRLGASVALSFLRELYRDPAHEVRFVTRELEAAAIENWLIPFADHPVSLADAVSFEIMKSEQIGSALTLDRHFEVAGFETLRA